MIDSMTVVDWILVLLVVLVVVRLEVRRHRHRRRVSLAETILLESDLGMTDEPLTVRPHRSRRAQRALDDAEALFRAGLIDEVDFRTRVGHLAAWDGLDDSQRQPQADMREPEA